MAQYFSVHPEDPQPRLIRAAVDIIRKGGVVAYPTDSCYALGCHIGDKHAMERIRRIRDVDERHHFTLVCRNLSEVGQFAKVDNLQYRLMRANTPGSYTFILPATREVPKRLAHPKKKTVGVRIPDSRVVQALLRELGDFEVDLFVGDIDSRRAQATAAWIREGSLRPGEVHAFHMPAEGSSPELEEALTRGHILLDCLPGKEAPRMARFARRFDLHYANLTEHVKETEEIQEIAEGAERGFILQTGLAPGYINVLGHHLFQRFCREHGGERADRLEMRVGALTTHARPPHYYGFTWSSIGVATEYVEPADRTSVRTEADDERLRNLSEDEELWIRQLLDQQFGNQLYEQGLKVFTTLDLDLQEYIATIFPMLPIGTKVTVVNQPTLHRIQDGRLYVQSLPPHEEHPEAKAAAKAAFRTSMYRGSRARRCWTSSPTSSAHSTRRSPTASPAASACAARAP